jgi:hypothetical protein
MYDERIFPPCVSRSAYAREQKEMEMGAYRLAKLGGGSRGRAVRLADRGALVRAHARRLVRSVAARGLCADA